jgi:broad specificity phosphatase PhoE
MRGTPRALATARQVGERLGVPVRTVAGLHEHDRRDTGLLGDAEFERAISELFARPDDLVFGRETAAAALARFDTAVAGVLAAAPRDDDVLVVSHGTVIALYVAARSGTDGRALWKRLGLPSFEWGSAGAGKAGPGRTPLPSPRADRPRR